MGAPIREVTPNGFYVTVVTPKGSTTKKIEGDVLTVGRAETCGLAIPHETLSRRHMTVQLKNGQCSVEDHGSANGTYVNGKRLKPHTSTTVLPEDDIQLGQSGVRLNLSTEQQMLRNVTPPLQNENKLPAVETIVTSTVTERKLLRIGQVMPEAKKHDEAQQQSEKMIQDAQKKASTLVQDAEIEAERRVQDIYRRAHETQAKMDEIYQRRMNEAYRAAETMYQKSQGEAEVILENARNKSAEIRAQAEGFVMELRQRTEEDCERILDEAQLTARELKENRLQEAEDILRKKEEELVKVTRGSMDTRLARFEEDLLKEAARQREKLDSELNDRRVQLETDHKDQIEALEKLKKEVKSIASQRDKEAEHLRVLETASEQKSQQNNSLKEELAAAQKNLTAMTETMATLRKEIDHISKAREEGKSVLAKIKAAQDNLDGELLGLREKFEDSKGLLVKEERKHLEELKLQTARKVQSIEQELMRELSEKKEMMARELSLRVETFLKEHPESKTGGVRGLQNELVRHFDSQIVTLSKDPSAKAKQKSLVSLKQREKWFRTFVGLTMGVAATFGGQKVYEIVQGNQAPLQRRVVAAAEERKQDLERRKFNPPQTPELRISYTESVIYTDGFTNVYLSDDFQRKLLPALSPYLLKTFRVDEDKVIELLSITNALVKVLAERKETIHPDFVPQGLAKMKEAETEAILRIRKLLGSQVRSESFRKFERKFYEDYVSHSH